MSTKTVDYIPYPVALHTVDIIPYIFEISEVSFLLGRKPGDDKFCTVGGFTDPILDFSAEESAMRELKEETGLTSKFEGTGDTLNNLEYVGSIKVNDERYTESSHKIITSVYRVRLSKKAKNKPKAGDDLEEVKWFTLEELLTYKDFVVKKHWPLIESFIIKKYML